MKEGPLLAATSRAESGDTEQHAISYLLWWPGAYWSILVHASTYSITYGIGDLRMDLKTWYWVFHTSIKIPESKTDSEVLPDTESVVTLNLTDSGTVKTKCLCFVNYSVYSIYPLLKLDVSLSLQGISLNKMKVNSCTKTVKWVII